MDAKILCVLFWALIYAHGQRVINETNEFWNSCINSNNGSYYCATSLVGVTGDCWLSGQSKSDCLGSYWAQYSHCSDENFEDRSKYLLCPTEESQCQNIDPIQITMDEQSNRIDTGNVSSGISCQYMILILDYDTFRSNNTNTYDVTVDVEYVQDNTYLGVYKYNLFSGVLFELIREVEAGYTGSIKVTMELTNLIFVQMYPNNSVGSATFTINAKKASNDDDGLSTAEVFVIVLAIAWFFLMLILGLIVACSIYRKFCKSKSMLVHNSAYQPANENQNQMESRDRNMHYTNENQVAMDIANLEILGEDEAAFQHTLPPISIKQKNEVESRNKSLRLPDPARRM